MDWSTHTHRPPTRADPSAPQLLETCWRMKMPTTGKVLTCAIYRHRAPGVEVRAQVSDEDLIKSQRTAELSFARATAEEWRTAVVNRGFTEIERS